ncbi:MAG: ABC transporter permease [Verrucomicrobia bacterium]|nr:ABC transporter permease [Verrucomicrobiota bacterium]
MRPFITIAGNAFMELVRQPVFLLLMTCSATFIIFLAAVPYFGLGEDPKMVKDSVLAVTLVTGLFGAVLSASASVAHEIRSGTALAVLAKPVSRARFILAKYAGLAGALALLTYVNLVAVLLASRMAYDAYGDADLLGTGIFCGAVALAYSIGGFTNYFLRRPFVADAVALVAVLVTISFFVINCFDKEGTWQEFCKGMDWRLVPATILVLFALWILAGLALACSTRLEMIPTLAVCTALFLLGLMSDYLFGQLSGEPTVLGRIGWMLYAVTPNWQLFWIADAIQGDVTRSVDGVWGYVGKAFAYVVGYLGASLALALILFEDRELS